MNNPSGAIGEAMVSHKQLSTMYCRTWYYRHCNWSLPILSHLEMKNGFLYITNKFLGMLMWLYFSHNYLKASKKNIFNNNFLGKPFMFTAYITNTDRTQVVVYVNQYFVAVVFTLNVFTVFKNIFKMVSLLSK